MWGAFCGTLVFEGINLWQSRDPKLPLLESIYSDSSCYARLPNDAQILTNPQGKAIVKIEGEGYLQKSEWSGTFFTWMARENAQVFSDSCDAKDIYFEYQESLKQGFKAQ